MFVSILAVPGGEGNTLSGERNICRPEKVLGGPSCNITPWPPTKAVDKFLTALPRRLLLQTNARSRARAVGSHREVTRTGTMTDRKGRYE